MRISAWRSRPGPSCGILGGMRSALGPVGPLVVSLSLVATLFDERRGPLATHMRKRLEGQPTWHEALAEHEQVYRCLALRDPLLAEAAMRSHIRAAADRWVIP